jgi:hypothetical protein
MTSLFLAHSHQDKPFARRLAQDLTARGVRVWIDESELLIGDSLIDKVQRAIAEMEYLAAVISRHSVQSAWVQKELEVALSLEIEMRRVKVLPIVIDDCSIPPFLINKVYGNFRDPRNYDVELQRLLLRFGLARVSRRRRSGGSQESVRLLLNAQEIVAGASPTGYALSDVAALLFALLDGSYFYLNEWGCCRLGAFFAALETFTRRRCRSCAILPSSMATRTS